MRIYIKDKLKASGMTMAQIADAVGVSPGAVSMWGSGRFVPTADKLPALAAALGCTVNALYREEVTEDD